MRKTPPKLALHMETVLTLTAKELRRAAGGLDTETAADVVAQSRDKQCVVAAALLA